MLVVSREDDLDFSSPEYQDLHRRSAATLFQHPVWLRSLYGSLAPARNAAPLVVTGREEATGRLVLVLPLVARRRGPIRRVEFADLGVCDYAAAVLDPAAASALENDHVSRDIRAALGPVDLVWVEKIPAAPELLGRLLGARETVRQRYDTHTIALGPSFEAWRQTLDPQFVRHLDRKRRRLRPRGELRLREVSEPDEIEDALARMRRFRQARFADRRAQDLVQDPASYAFYHEVAKASAAIGGPGRTSVLTLGDDVVAASFGLADDLTHLFLLVGYDVERLRNYSLGLLIVEELIALSISRGHTTFDLTIGNEGYKTDFGAAPAAVHAVHDPVTWRGVLAKAAADREAVARLTAKRLLESRPRRAAHLLPRPPAPAKGRL